MFTKFALPTVLLLLALSLSSCIAGNSTAPTPTDTSPTDSASVTTENKPSLPKPAEVTVNETVIYAANDCKVTVKGLEYGGILGPRIKLALENNSNRDVAIQVRRFSVNDLMIETYFSTTVAAEKKANDAITISEADLKRADIQQMKNIEFVLHFYDPQTYDTFFDSEPISLTTSADPGYTQPYNAQGTLALEDDRLRIVVGRKKNDTDPEQTHVTVYIENKSDKELTIQTDSVAVNGYMIDPLFSASVAPGKKRIDLLTFHRDELEENDISSLDSLEIAFRIIDWDRYSESYTSDKVTVAFE